MHELLEERRRESEEGLTLVREACAERIAPIVGEDRLSIYATGSFGRLEAAYPSSSDLDLFFLYGPRDEDPQAALPNLKWIELAAAVIDVARELHFPEFSRDGEYLNAHNVWYIGQQLGSPHEDAENGFTARLLLLLESRHVLDERLYDELVERTISFYFEDFDQNREKFRPTFLLNDILRFWRTLCLNYENKRGRKRREAKDQGGDAAWRAESAVDNVKLRFSRLSTCYSMIAALGASPTPVTLERVVELSRLPPVDRWAVAAGDDPDARGLVERLLAMYAEFLTLTADKEGLLEEMRDPAARQKTRQQAREFGELVAELLERTTLPEQRRILVI